ncbi:MAG: hypothetical protein M3Z62_00460 [Metasolibacillus sp.]|nr:hypothetical protein [Metasolibacillus sp.]
MLTILSFLKKLLSWIMVLSVLYLSHEGVQVFINEIRSMNDIDIVKQIRGIYGAFIIITISILAITKIIFKTRISADAFFFAFSMLAILALAFKGNDDAASFVILSYLSMSVLIILIEKYFESKLKVNRIGWVYGAYGGLRAAKTPQIDEVLNNTNTASNDSNFTEGSKDSGS